MAITFDLPSDIEQSLRHQCGNLGHVAKEALLLALYRQGKITHHELSRAMGISRLETEALLKQQNVMEDLPTDQEHQAALARLRGMAAK